ncbi:MAG: polysaccharide biosynthesis/export family protein [Bacteroidaceae bacterium]|nr:polysaccharide biosynthesis/export family protein [Bacteroidaceae bacterium]
MKRIILSVAVCTTLLFSACTSYKNVPYVMNSDSLQNVVRAMELYDAKIMPKDLLTITVNTTDPKVSAPYNLTVQSNAAVALSSSSVTTQAALQQYLVSNEGTIDFPGLGELHVAGLTKNECERMLKQKLKTFIEEDMVVNVRMPNFKISVVGEVNRPGQFTVTNEKINIFEALAQAGDMTIYGLRDNVKVLREDANGVRQYHNLNLNDANVIFSPYYQLQQNDIVIVTPNKTKAKNSDVGTSTSLWFSATSILVSLASLLYNILK